MPEAEQTVLMVVRIRSFGKYEKVRDSVVRTVSRILYHEFADRFDLLMGGKMLKYDSQCEIPGHEGHDVITQLPDEVLTQTLEGMMGKATWEWDEDLLMHVPCCSQYSRGDRGGWRCGNGPLTGDQIMTGDCGQHG